MENTKTRLAMIGVSGRGMSQMGLLLAMDDVDIVAVCDLYEDRMQAAADKIMQERGTQTKQYADYKEMIRQEELDGVVITSSWDNHIQAAVCAMRYGVYPAMEVGGACSVNECWTLVRASEETGIPCMMLENCCYGREELALLNMVKQGLFGEVVHCEGAYSHDLRAEVSKGEENRHYRLRNYKNRNAELYPTHELGPIAKWLDINRGNRMLTLTATASKARGVNHYAREHQGAGHPNAAAPFNQGDIVTTVIKCAHGETIMLVHDTTLPRPYSRGNVVRGTKGIYMEANASVHIEGLTPDNPNHWDPAAWEPLGNYFEQYDHPVWKEYFKLGVRGGHGGMDYLVLRAYVESLRNGTPPPVDVYDAASWMVITVLSEESIMMGSHPVAIPDFTDGKWLRRDELPAGRYNLDRVCFEAFDQG